MFLSLLLLYELHMSEEAQRLSPSQILLEQQQKKKNSTWSICI